MLTTADGALAPGPCRTPFTLPFRSRIMSFNDLLNIGLMQGFAGLSLFAVLLLMGLGLAIIFGQMGVINMAHGEFMTIGAYTIYLGSTLAADLAPQMLPSRALAYARTGQLGLARRDIAEFSGNR